MPVSFDTKAFRESLNDLEAGIRNASAQAMRASVQAAEASAKSTPLFQDRTGVLRQRTNGTADGLTGKLVADTKYAKYIENGTPPHVITAKSGGSLSFVVNGTRVFAKSVNHPGTAERPFMEQASRVGQQTLEYGMEYLVGEAIVRGDR